MHACMRACAYVHLHTDIHATRGAARAGIPDAATRQRSEGLTLGLYTHAAQAVACMRAAARHCVVLDACSFSRAQLANFTPQLRDS